MWLELAKDRLEPVITEEASLVFGKLFRSILEMFRIQVFLIEVLVILNRFLRCDSLALLSFQLSNIGP